MRGAFLLVVGGGVVIGAFACEPESSTASGPYVPDSVPIVTPPSQTAEGDARAVVDGDGEAADAADESSADATVDAQIDGGGDAGDASLDALVKADATVKLDAADNL